MAIIFIKSLSTQSSLTRRFFSSVRALGVALIVIATLLSTVDAYALTRSKSTKYGTLRYTIHNLDGKYKPGEHYSLVATFAANDNVYGSQSRRFWKSSKQATPVFRDRSPSHHPRVTILRVLSIQDATRAPVPRTYRE